jgi:hypothetical protein
MASATKPVSAASAAAERSRSRQTETVAKYMKTT